MSTQHWQTLGEAMRREFGCNVWKVSIDAGFACPNVDGCIFCRTSSFAPSRRTTPGLSIYQQIDEGIRQLRRRYRKAEKFIAYFQPSTNTYGPPERLEAVYGEALEHPEIVGLAIGTRPDALPENVLDLLARISERHFLQLEIGLQSIHQKSLDFLNRHHDYPTFLDAFERSRRHGLRLGVHLILGLPGEERQDVLETAAEMARLRPECVKLHNLYVVRDTPLASVANLRLPTLEEYASLVVDFLERMPPETVVERISGDAPDEDLIAPDWTRIKHAARNAVDREFRRRGTEQGRKFTT